MGSCGLNTVACFHLDITPRPPPLPLHPCTAELDDGQRRRLVDAMFERHCSPGQTLIRQGEEGDFFYVVDHGRFVASQGGRTLFVYEGAGERTGSELEVQWCRTVAEARWLREGDLLPGVPCPPLTCCTIVTGSFGELALLYNCPRAATVTADSAGVVWTLDRATFRSLVVGAMEERRRR